MKFRIRKPSIRRRIAARTSPKRFIRHSLELKAPKGLGVVTNPRRALYNKVYRSTSIGIDEVVPSGSSKARSSTEGSTPNSKPAQQFRLDTDPASPKPIRRRQDMPPWAGTLLLLSIVGTPIMCCITMLNQDNYSTLLFLGTITLIMAAIGLGTFVWGSRNP